MKLLRDPRHMESLDQIAPIVPLTNLIPFRPKSTGKVSSHLIQPNETQAATFYVENGGLSFLTNFSQKLKRCGVKKSLPNGKNASFYIGDDNFIIKFWGRGNDSWNEADGTAQTGIRSKGNSFSLRSKTVWEQLLHQCLNVDEIDIKKAFSEKSISISMDECKLHRDEDEIPYIVISLEDIAKKLSYIQTFDKNGQGSFNLENYMGSNVK